MFMRFIYAIGAGIITTLVAMLLGSVLGIVEIGWVAALGAILKTYAGMIGLVVAIWYFCFGFRRWPLP